MSTLHSTFVPVVLCLPTPAGLETNLSTSALELNVSPQLENSLEYDSYFIVYFYQDQMDIQLNLKKHFSIPPYIQLKAPLWHSIKRITFYQCVWKMFLNWLIESTMCILVQLWSLKSLDLFFKGRRLLKITKFCFIKRAHVLLCFAPKAENTNIYNKSPLLYSHLLSVFSITALWSMACTAAFFVCCW